jgi:glycerophosphoryl diester phosphodiesterase
MLIPQGPYIAHRGASKQAPENTLAAFRRAYALGANSTELDVALSSDGEMFILHDDTLDRTTNGRGPISGLTANEISRLDAGSWFSPAHADEQVPKLAEVLDWAKDKIHLTIEMKPSSVKAGVAERLVSMINARDMTDQVSVISFASDFVNEVEELAPAIDTGLLLSERPTVENTCKGAKLGLAVGVGAGLLGSLSGVLSPMAALGVAAASVFLGGWLGKLVVSAQHRKLARNIRVDTVMPFWLDANKGLVRAAQEHGKRVVPYTANNPKLVGHLFDNGVTAVICDVPERFCTPRC